MLTINNAQWLYASNVKSLPPTFAKATVGNVLSHSHTLTLVLPPFPPSKPVVPVYINDKGEYEYHADHLGVFQYFLARFASRDHFKQCEQYVSAIQRRYGQNIHECKGNGEECSDHPERLPVPHRREHRAHG